MFAEQLSERSPVVPSLSLARPIHVLVLIPTLDVGGAETDLVRTLPRIDSGRFRITVCTFLSRGELGKVLQDRGIEVIGPISPSVFMLRQHLDLLARRLKRALLVVARQLGSKIKNRGVTPRLSSMLQRTLLAARTIRSVLQRSLRAIMTCIRPLLSLIRSIAYLLEIVRLARPIARHIRASKVDLVHTILPNSYLVGACASALSGRRPILMSRVSLNVYQSKYRLVGFIERHLLHRIVDAAIGNSNAVLKDLRAEGISESRLYLVHNGIDVRSFESEMLERSQAHRVLGTSDGALVFSVVANLHSYKGHSDLFTALATFSKRFQSDWLCLLVGRDVENNLPKLKRQCLAHGLTQNVRFLGPRRDVPVVLSASDIHISASHEEGLPNNIIEAMCASLPVVATAVGGVPELVVDGQTGYLVEPRDTDRIADALLALAQSPEQREAFGAAGYERAVSRFSIDGNVRAFETIYADVACIRSRNRGLDRDWFSVTA